jgi:biotin transport system substrate-specific component
MQIGSETHPTLAAALWPAQGVQAALRWLLLAIVGSIFVALCAQIQVPLTPVPITMQTFAVLLIGAAYGWRLGGATLALYAIEGAAGLPVFAGWSGGWHVIAGPTGFTGGYIIGFIFAAALVGWLAERGWDRTPILTGVAMVLGNLVIYALGLVWLSQYMGGETVGEIIGSTLAAGLFPFLIGDALKIARAMAVLPAAWKIVASLRR